MKTHYVIYPAMVAMLSTGCGNSNTNVNKESIEAQNEMSGELHKDDTMMIKRDGTVLSGTLDQADSVNLPSPVINAIEKDKQLAKAAVASTKKITENSRTVYEVEFILDNEDTKKVKFFENGSIKPEN